VVLARWWATTRVWRIRLARIGSLYVLDFSRNSRNRKHFGGGYSREWCSLGIILYSTCIQPSVQEIIFPAETGGASSYVFALRISIWELVNGHLPLCVQVHYTPPSDLDFDGVSAMLGKLSKDSGVAYYRDKHQADLVMLIHPFLASTGNLCGLA